MYTSVKKLVIPAAGWGTRFLPLTKIVHKELAPILNKPILHYLVEEASLAGIEDVILVLSERKKDIKKYFEDAPELEKMLKETNKNDLLEKANQTKSLARIKIVYQKQQLGLAHALSKAKDEVNGEPFAVILGDDLIKSKVPAIKQLIDKFLEKQSTILGVQSVEDEVIHKYGIMEPLNEYDKDKEIFKIKRAIEKPTNRENAPSNKAILGRYVFTPEAMDIFANLKQHGNEEINVVDAFDELLKKQDIYAFEFSGRRYDLGSMEEFVKANIDYSLENNEIKESILKHLKESDLIYKKTK